MESKRPTALEFVREASSLTLENFELARRNEAATLAKQIRLLVWQMAENIADAELARLWRESRSGGVSDEAESALALGATAKGVMLTAAEGGKPDSVGRRRL